MKICLNHQVLVLHSFIVLKQLVTSLHLLVQIYELLYNLGIKKINVQHNTFDIMYLKNVMKEILCTFEDNSFQMNVESWGNRGNKV